MVYHQERLGIGMEEIREVIRRLERFERRMIGMEKVVDALYRVSNEIHGILNGCGSFEEGLFWAKGKIFTDETEAHAFFDPNPKPIVFESFDEEGNSLGGWCQSEEGDNFEMLDCRNENVDMEIKVFIKDRIYWYLNKFYSQNNTDDEFLLFLGFTINLYYIIGMYSTFGKFDLKPVECFVQNEPVKDYSKLINEFLYAKITEQIIKEIEGLEFENRDLYHETINKILKGNECYEMDILYKCIKECDRNYVPDVFMLLNENDFKREASDYLREMINNYPEFRFGWVYNCLEKGIQFYETKGNNIEVFGIKDNVGDDLFFHILGFGSYKGQNVTSLDGGKWEVKDGNIETIRPAIFSEFGIGIPKIKVNIRNDYLLMKKLMSNKDEIETVSYKSIRRQTEEALGINLTVEIDTNPMDYTGKLLEVIKKQNKELEESNKELRKLNEQRCNLVDHLAHSWGNECYPEIVKKVAEELLKKGDNSLANRLFKAYNSENNLMGEIVFLQAAMASDPKVLQDIFKDSFYISGDGKKEWKIQMVIEETLEILFFGLLHDSGDKFKRKKCKEKLCVKHSIQELSEDYVRRIEIGSQSESFVQWFSNNIFPIVIQIDNTWKSINLGRTEYGKVVMKNIFTELFTNMLFHGNNRCEIAMTSDDEKMYITMKNDIAEDNQSGNEKGLNSLSEVVARLNYNTTVSETEGIKHKKVSENEYETEIVLAKELMFVEEW